ncbi:MAG: arsenate reductase family protein, partial [Flavobacteriaceae bacterium]
FNDNQIGLGHVPYHPLSMIKIFHNPRCQKSRNALSMVSQSGEAFQVVDYQKEIPTKAELLQIIERLGIAPETLVRKNEALWKEKYRDRKFSGDEIIDLLLENPKLIERPILVKGNRAIIGRAEDKVREFMKTL